MDEIKKIAGINLIILATYTILIPLFAGTGSERGYAILFGSAFLIVLQVAFNFIVAIVLLIIGKKGMGLSFLATGALVLLVGFSTCLGSTALFS